MEGSLHELPARGQEGTTEAGSMMRFRWWLWWHLCKLPNICPANAHSVLIWKTRRDPRIDAMCRKDAAECDGVCYCGKIRPAP